MYYILSAKCSISIGMTLIRKHFVLQLQSEMDKAIKSFYTKLHTTKEDAILNRHH